MRKTTVLATSIIDKLADELYIESIEDGYEMTSEEYEAAQKANNLFDELKADLPPYLVKKLLDYEAAIGDSRLLSSAKAFKSGFSSGVKMGIEVYK